jgi:hypothetical protein
VRPFSSGSKLRIANSIVSGHRCDERSPAVNATGDQGSREEHLDGDPTVEQMAATAHPSV